MMATLATSQNLGGGGVGGWEREREKNTNINWFNPDNFIPKSYTDAKSLP